MGMGDWYFFTNQLRDICEKIMIRTCGLWTLVDERGELARRFL
jgi:hypothetical protein